MIEELPPIPNEKGNILPILPDDIKNYIYNEFLWFDVEKKPQCDELLNWYLNDEDAQRLRLNNNVLNLINELLTCKTSVEYLCSKDAEFKKCYEDHYVKNKKYFDLMSILESFALSILMYKYH